MNIAKLANYMFGPNPDERDQYRVGMLIVAPSGKCLAVLRNASKKTGGGTWGLPGGHIDPLETFLLAAVREAYEETGIAVSRAKLLGCKEIDGKKYVLFAGAAAQEFNPMLDHEHTDSKWVTPENWPNKAFPGLSAILKDDKALATIRSLAAPQRRAMHKPNVCLQDLMHA